MKTVINNVLDQHKSGLVILGLSTGYGKTYHIIETINNLLASKEFKENIYFITNQHVNIESVYDKITDKSNTLYLKSRSQILKNLLIKDQNLYSWFRDNLPKIKIKDKEALEKITVDMLNIEGYEYVSKAISEIKKSIIDYFSTNIKRKSISSKTQFESWLKASFEGKQIAKIFPEIEIDKKQVVMMTTSKMMNPLTYIYKSPKHGWEHIARDKKAMVFFDESDIVANEIQKSLFDNMISIDLLNSIKRIEVNLKKLAKDFLDDVDRKGLRSYCDNLINAIENGIIDKFAAANTYYTKGDDWDNNKITLFKYLNSMYIASNNLFIKKIDSKLQNYIYNNNEHKFDYKLSDLVEATLSFIDKLFLPTAYNFAKKLSLDDDSSPEEELKVFLDAFLNTDNSCLKSYAQRSYTNLAYFKSEPLRRSKTFNFYKYGLDITTCETVNVRNVAKIYTHKCYLTKERILENIARNNLVFCVSATAEVYNPTVNFDMQYLKHTLDNNYINIDLSLKQQLSNEYHKRFDKLNNKIKIAPIKPVDEFGLLDDINLEDYDIQRNKRCFGFIKEFAQSDMVVALAFFNRGLSENTKFNEQLIIRCMQKYGLQADNFLKINAQELSKDVEHSNLIERRLKHIYSNHNLQKKLIIFTAYDSASAGLNLHYDVGILEQGEPINKKIDIDALYLDDINHLLPHKYDYDSVSANQQLISALYAYTYLYENDELSEKQYKRILRQLQKNQTIRTKDFTKLKAVNNKAVAKIIQAVGRICRTDNKREVTRIFYSPGIADVLANYNREDFIQTREFETLLNHIQSIKTKDLQCDDVKKMNNHVTRINRRARTLITDLLDSINQYSKEQRYKEWQELRSYSLKKPTADSFEGVNQICELYLDTDKILDEYKDKNTGNIRYVEEDDYKKVHLVNSGGLEISSSSAGLDRLMKVPVIREYFEKNGYATNIDCKAKYILSPVMFNNIYKGAIGEAVVECIFSRIGIELEQLDDESYERMDFRVKDTDIYIDAKLVKPSEIAMNEELNDKCLNKAEKLKAKKLVLINILETNTQEPLQRISRYTLDNGTKVSIFSWIIDRNNRLTQETLATLEQEIK